jgi:hypothetical protein
MTTDETYEAFQAAQNPPPPPPRRSFLPEQSWGISTPSHTPMFSPEEIRAAHESWVNVLKGVMPNCSEFQLRSMAMDRAVSELQASRAETL